MTREQINQILIERGVETPSGLLISALLDAINAEKKQAVEEATKTATEKAQEQFKDYVKPDDFKKLQDEITTLKDSSAKAERTAKLKAKGINEKYLEYADSKLKDSKDFDKDLESFVKDNAELLGKVEDKKTNPQEIKFGNVIQEGGKNPNPNYSMFNAVADALNTKK